HQLEPSGLELRSCSGHRFPEALELAHRPVGLVPTLADQMATLNPGPLGRLQYVAVGAPRHEIAELPVHTGWSRILQALSDHGRHEPCINWDLRLEESQAAVVVHVGVRQQHALDLGDSAIVGVIPVALPEIGLVATEVVAIEALE